MTRGIFTSEFWWCIVVAVCSLFFVTQGHVTWNEWVDLIKWLSVAYIGAKALQKGSYYFSNGKKGTLLEGQTELFKHE